MTISGLILSPTLSLGLKKAIAHFIFPSPFRSEKIFSLIEGESATTGLRPTTG